MIRARVLLADRHGVQVHGLRGGDLKGVQLHIMGWVGEGVDTGLNRGVVGEGVHLGLGGQGGEVVQLTGINNQGLVYRV